MAEIRKPNEYERRISLRLPRPALSYQHSDLNHSSLSSEPLPGQAPKHYCRNARSKLASISKVIIDSPALSIKPIGKTLNAAETISDSREDFPLQLLPGVALVRKCNAFQGVLPFHGLSWVRNDVSLCGGSNRALSTDHGSTSKHRSHSSSPFQMSLQSKASLHQPPPQESGICRLRYPDA